VRRVGHLPELWVTYFGGIGQATGSDLSLHIRTYLNYIFSAYSDMTSDNTITKLDTSVYTNITLTVFSSIKPIARLVELKPALDFKQQSWGLKCLPMHHT
jgi:hypothetical protein